MIIYGIASDTSVIQLFAAGIGPGLLLAGLFGIYIYYHSIQVGITETGKFSFREFLRGDARRHLGARRHRASSSAASIRACSRRPRRPASPASMPSSSAISSTAKSTLAELFETAARAMYLTGLIFIIVSVAGLYAWLLTISGIAQAAVSASSPACTRSRWVVLLVINLFLLFVGCFLDPASALIMLTPLLAPVAASLGVDPIHFGVIVVMNLTIGTFHPPFGLNIFVMPGAVQDAVGDALYGTDPVRHAGDRRAAAGDLYSGDLAVGF